MKKLPILSVLLLTIITLRASDLIYLKVTDNLQMKNLAAMSQISLNYLGNGFVIATRYEEVNLDYVLLEKEGWTKNHAYFLSISSERGDQGYRQQISRIAAIIYETEELFIFKVDDREITRIDPPVNGSLTRLWNKPVPVPDERLNLSKAPLSPDPFIVARIAEVDTGLIHANVKHLQDYGTRRCTKAEAILAQNWIKGMFEGYGLTASLFDFSMPYGACSDNVIAVKTGTLYPNEYVIIGGHYDSYSSGSTEPGADDNATGTSGVLEVARILSPYTFDRTIIFCAFSGEEFGLYGSEAYAAWCETQGMNILGYFNMDMAGYLKAGDPIHTDIIAPASAQDLVDFYTDVAAVYLPSFIVAEGTLTGGDSDHTSFNDHGFMGIFPFEDSQDYSPYIHSVNDLIGPSVNNFEQVGVFTKAMLAATVSLANMVPPQQVTLSGTVTDFATGLPVAGATLEPLNTAYATVTTNASGYYSFGNILEDTYHLRLKKEGYATELETVFLAIPDTIADFQLMQSTPWDFETGVFEPYWTFGGVSPWTISTEAPFEGLYCSKSGTTGDSQSSEMSIELYLTASGTVSFYCKVSSESGYDFLKFYIDNILQGQWSGIQAWAEVNYSVASGLHTFKWAYSKDANTIAGSDCAWVDYIIFPPIAPVPDPPDISVSPASFSRTLATGASESAPLSVTNIGEMDLTYTATVVYAAGGGSPATLYPLNANYNTGTTTSSAKTQTSLVKGYPTTEAGWMKFDISSIPDGAVITSVEFHGYVNAANYPYWNINPVSVDPATASSSVLYADIVAESSSGYYLYRSETSSYSTGWKVHTLGGNVNANLQASLAQDWFAIGIMDRDNSSSYYIGFDGWAQANRPYLVVGYTYTPPYTWLKVNGSGTTAGTISQGNSHQVTVGFEAGTLPEGTYTANVKVTSNDPVDPVVMIPCSLTVQSLKHLNLALLLEGLYNPSTGWMEQARDENGARFGAGIADQLTVELHEAGNYLSTLCTLSHVNLGTNGQCETQIIPAAYNGSYYITVKHRNSIETTTSAPVSFAGSTISYDFSASPSKAFGSNQKVNTNGTAAIYAGDANQDGIVDSGDINLVDNESTAITMGYVSEDINGDGIVDSGDMNIADNNSTSVIMAIVP